jgi:tRNA(fMet)-specific endonuclease VapC
MFLLDTDTISLMQFGHPVVLKRAASHPETSLFISSISVQEQMKGWITHAAQTRTRLQLADWHDHLVNRIFPVWKRYALLAFPEPAILRFEHLRSLRLNVGHMDLRLAAIALQLRLTVVTRNRRDFGRVPGLNIEDWSV